MGTNRTPPVDDPYDLLFRRSPRPAYIFDATTLRFLDVNDAALALYGYTKEEFLGLTLLEIRPTEDIPKLLNAMRSDEMSDATWRHKDRSGRVIMVEVVYQRTTWEGIGAVLVSVVDVSAREAVRRDLELSEERFRVIFDASPIGIVSADADFRFLEANPAFCRLVGYPLEQLREMTFLDVTHPDDRDTDADLARQLLGGEIPFYSLEKRYITSADEIVWVNVTGFVTHRPDGSVRYAMGLVEDITERKRRDERARADAAEAHRLLSELTDREREILDLARTRSAREIAEVLTISPRTAESHLASAYRKLRATSRHEALAEYDTLLSTAGISPTAEEVRVEAP